MNRITPYNHKVCRYRTGCSRYCVHKHNDEKYSQVKRVYGERPKIKNLSKCDPYWCPFKVTTVKRKV